MAELEREVGATRSREGISLERSQLINAGIDAVYAVLSDPKGLGRLLPRVTRLRMRKTGEHSADLTTWMQFPVVGEVQTEGEIAWQAPREVVYRSKSTLPVVARWTLAPQGTGTCLTARLDLNLAPLLGPMAAFVPEQAVKDVMARELDKALDAIAAQV